MKLIASLTSPYARKVRIVLAEKKIDCPLITLSPWEPTDGVSDYNPLGKVPVLTFDDGTTLYDSRVIVEYLDTISPVSRLFPDDKRQCILTRRWEALADGIIDSAVTIVLEKRRPTSQQSEEWIKRQHEKIERGVQSLAHDLGERPWCQEDGYSLADIAVGCCLGYLAFRFPQIAWQTDYPKLAAFHSKLEERQTFIDTKAQ